ncbi:MAG: bifunctional diaminohydroxyphosphoribosylaminopyrimidine deaminase/5-amino-6-(5-phosphoribosylamino)uracil reductase RibD [Gemmataceae bacterium]|nr:bifunctional diaminohydroxyphosphoribosylaminopyrimidine deaminase/5-amino-6-(5-phosphoribosylamino)uracil reductase RibD [Gemmataceae bacterium]
MARAIELAERGRGRVEPNPLVGAVVVRDGRIVGEGWHQRYGEAHAEINALKAAGDMSQGATIYVTLEPCCHHGKTPPCTDALLRAGVARVVAAIADPFPQVAGRGADQLREASIAVEIGLLGDEAARQNAPYLRLLCSGRPYVHAKWAMSLDGKIATRTGDSRWISNEASRRIAHELRGRMDGILVGIGTVLADDPRLTARPPGPRFPTRVVLDATAKLPLASKLVQTAREIPVLVAVAMGAETKQVDALRGAGCEVVVFPEANPGRIDVSALLQEFGKRRWTNLLVEGGSQVFAAFFESDAIDEVHAFMAPTLVGGREAPSPLGGLGVAAMGDALRLQEVQMRVVDGDVYVRGVR